MKSGPKFNKPPVVETVLGVQFRELSGFRAAHFGLFWAQISDEFAKIQDQPRLSPIVESFPRNISLPKVGLQMAPRTIPDRVWYVTSSDSELIQLQPDRFIFNWRQRQAEYPTFAKTKEKFLAKFDVFAAFCESQGLGRPSVGLCEVSYVNHLIPIEGETAIQLAEKVFTGLQWSTCEQGLPIPEGFVFNRVFVITNNGVARGRLYAESSIAMSTEDRSGQEFVVLRMTARVNHPTGSDVELAESVQLAHDWVVGGFVSVTDAGIQKERWERIE